jgi:hypothetical protein
MSLFDILSVAALAASVVMLFDAGARLPAMAVAVAAGLQAGILFQLLQVRSGGFPLPLALAFAVVLAAGFAWTRAQAKPAITAATAATLAGAIQVLRGLKIV